MELRKLETSVNLAVKSVEREGCVWKVLMNHSMGRGGRHEAGTWTVPDRAVEKKLLTRAMKMSRDRGEKELAVMMPIISVALEAL